MSRVEESGVDMNHHVHTYHITFHESLHTALNEDG